MPNPTGTLLPGMYADVQLDSARTDPPVLIPGAALVVRSTCTEVAILEETGSTAKGFVGEDERKEDQNKAKKESKTRTTRVAREGTASRAAKRATGETTVASRAPATRNRWPISKPLSSSFI